MVTPPSGCARRFIIEVLGLEEENVQQRSMPWYYQWWIPPPMADKMVRLSIAPACMYFGLCPSSLVLTRAASKFEMHWASMLMHYTAFAQHAT